MATRYSVPALDSCDFQLKGYSPPSLDLANFQLTPAIVMDSPFEGFFSAKRYGVFYGRKKVSNDATVSLYIDGNQIETIDMGAMTGEFSFNHEEDRDNNPKDVYYEFNDGSQTIKTPTVTVTIGVEETVKTPESL